MNFGLRIVFEGVCSLVPDSPFFIRDPKTKKIKPGKPKKVTVLLTDLRSAGMASWSTPKSPVFRSAHWPLLTFDFLDYDAASTRPIDMILKDPSTGRERGLILLDHEELKVALTAAMQPRQLEPDLTVPKNLSYPDTSAGNPELTSLWWVPQMRQLSNGHGSVSKRNDPSRQDFRFGFGNRVIAALTIEKKGRFYVRDFNRTSYGQIRRWEFGYFNKKGKRYVLFTRAVGNQLALELEGLDSPAELVFTHKEQGSAPSDLKLVLRPPGASRRQTVELRVGNVEPEVLGPDGGVVTGSLFGGDPDFESFYGLSSGPVTSRMPVPLFPSSGPLGIRDKPCAPSASQNFG